MKLLVVGLDGFGAKHWHDFVNLPDWQTRTLHSPRPLSGPAWTSIYTGLTPEQHHVFDVWGRREDSSTHADVKARCVWNVLYAQGVTCDIVGMPITWPASCVRPRFISGFWQGNFTHCCYPVDAEPERFEDYLSWMDAVWWTSNNPKECGGWVDKIVNCMTQQEFMQQLFTCTKLYVAHYIATHEESDLGMIGLTFFDRALHLAEAWGSYGDMVEELGGFGKMLIEKLRIALKPEKMLVVSDHGFNAKGHTHDGILAAKDFSPLGKDEWMTWDIAPLVARVFDTDWPEHIGSYQIEEYELMKGRLRKLGYIS